MAVEIMGKPIGKIKSIRSLDEILTRGGQAFSVKAETPNHLGANHCEVGCPALRGVPTTETSHLPVLTELLELQQILI